MGSAPFCAGLIMLAPAFARADMTGTLLNFEAKKKGVSLSLSKASTIAPDSRRNSVTGTVDLAAATCRQVAPEGETRLTSNWRLLTKYLRQLKEPLAQQAKTKSSPPPSMKDWNICVCEWAVEERACVRGRCGE